MAVQLRRGSGLLLVALSLLLGPITVVVGQTCQLCPSGSTMQSANKSIPTSLFQLPALVNVATCGDIDNQLSFIPTTTLCDAFLQPFLTAFDAQYYCGCTGIGAPNVCPFCGVVDPNVYLPSNLGLSAITCGDIATYVTSLLNASRCDSNTNTQFGQICCNAQTSTPGFSSSSSAPATTMPGTGASLAPGMTPAPFTAAPGGTLTSMPVTAVPLGNGSSSSSSSSSAPPASNYTGTQLPINLPGTTSLFPSTVPPGTGLPGATTQLPNVPATTAPPTTMVPAVIPPGMTPSPVTNIPVATGGLSQAPTMSLLPGGLSSNSSTGSSGGGSSAGMNETNATQLPNNATTIASRAPSPTFATVTTPAPIGKLSVRNNVTTSGGGSVVNTHAQAIVGSSTLVVLITISIIM